MVATVRLDKELTDTLNSLSSSLNKKKSEIIREAIDFYAKEYYKNRKKRILEAVEKVKEAELKENKLLEVTLGDGI